MTAWLDELNRKLEALDAGNPGEIWIAANYYENDCQSAATVDLPTPHLSHFDIHGQFAARILKVVSVVELAPQTGLRTTLYLYGSKQTLSQFRIITAMMNLLSIPRALNANLRTFTRFANDTEITDELGWWLGTLWESFKRQKHDPRLVDCPRFELLNRTVRHQGRDILQVGALPLLPASLAFSQWMRSWLTSKIDEPNGGLYDLAIEGAVKEWERVSAKLSGALEVPCPWYQPWPIGEIAIFPSIPLPSIAGLYSSTAFLVAWISENLRDRDPAPLVMYYDLVHWWCKRGEPRDRQIVNAVTAESRRLVEAVRIHIEKRSAQTHASAMTSSQLEIKQENDGVSQGSQRGRRYRIPKREAMDKEILREWARYKSEGRSRADLARDMGITIKRIELAQDAERNSPKKKRS